MIPTLAIMYTHPELQLHPQGIFFYFLVFDTCYLFDFKQYFWVCGDDNLLIRFT